MELRVFALAHAAPPCGSCSSDLPSVTAANATLRMVAERDLGDAGAFQLCIH